MYVDRGDHHHQDKSFIGQIVLKSFTTIIFCYEEQKPPPRDKDVFKTFLGRLKKVTTSYDQTRRR